MPDIVFTRKKVASLSLGERLRKYRLDYHMSLTEVSRATRIQTKYLDAIERGDYAHLPAEVYLRGFLRSYARHLGIDEEAILKMYGKEKNIEANLGRDRTASTAPPQSGRPAFILTARSLWTVVVVLILSGVAVYLGREFRNFAGTPRLFVYEPSDQAVLDTNEVIVRGSTEKGVRVLINDEPALVDGAGEFVEKLLLQPGINTINVKALNRFGKEKEERITVEARYGSQGADDEALPVLPNQEEFSVVIRAEGAAVNVSATADGTLIFSGRLADGEEKEIIAKEEIVVTTDRGNATLVRYPGKSAAALSDTTAPVAEAVFAPLPKE
jgi:transcriptional regulator with XRE-family HTH domain